MSSNTPLDDLAEHYERTDTATELEHATAAADPEAPPVGEGMTTFAVRLPVGVLDRVRELAGQRNLTSSALIRHWIESGLAEEGADTDDRVVPVQALLELIGRAPREHQQR